MRTAWALMVMPRSRSRSIASSTWACISRAVREPVNSSKRSERVDLPWSMWAMMAKFRMCLLSIQGCRSAGGESVDGERSLSPDLIIHTGGPRAIQSSKQSRKNLVFRVEPRLRPPRRFRMGLSRGSNIVCRMVMAVLAAASLLCTGCVPENPVTPGPAKSPQATAPALKPSKPSEPTAASANPPATPAARPQVQALIDAVEVAYQSGVTDYHAGKLQTAKADFDRAVDMMLTSNFDLRSEPQLRDEFDRILDAVNTLETEALKQGNGFAPKIEPAPVDIANDVTFPVDPTVKAQAIAELKTTVSDLPLVINDPVAGYISYFSSKGRGTLTRSLERAGRYHAMIATVLAEEKVPQDLIYQAVAESGFQPQAVNGHSGAGGMWQFMPSGVYGLTRNGWYDERFDPEKSTHAYARYMKELYAQLGDWYLAMAAYDWGPGNVQKAVQRTGYADFWELYRRNVLPQETKNYVPIILALTLIAKDAPHYGIHAEPDPPVPFEVVKPGRAIDLRLVAETIDVDVETLHGLNPSLLRLATPDDPAFELHLPPGTAGKFSSE